MYGINRGGGDGQEDGPGGVDSKAVTVWRTVRFLGVIATTVEAVGEVVAWSWVRR
jgi:hypothetical protein